MDKLFIEIKLRDSKSVLININHILKIDILPSVPHKCSIYLTDNSKIDADVDIKKLLADFIK